MEAIHFYPYGIAVASAAALSLFWAQIRSVRSEIPSGAASWFGLLSVPLGFLLARLGFLLVEYEYFLSDGFLPFLQFFFDFSSGGYLMYGALTGWCIAILLTARITHTEPVRLFDAFSPSIALMACLLCLADGIAGAGYGWGLEDWFVEGEGYSVFVLNNPGFFCVFPFSVQDYYGDCRWAVFLLTACLLAAVCVSVARTRRDSGCFPLFLLCYSSIQLLAESLRQDAIPKWGFVRVNQVLSAILIVFLLVRFLLTLKAPPKEWILSASITFAGFLIVTAMEFAMEGKISVIEWMPMDCCYAFTALAAALILRNLLRLWKKAFPVHDHVS